jgi:ATP-binding cassette subfamily F protein uup
VSHDRRFLDNVVTSTIAFEGDGRWQEYVGGYADWLRQAAARDRATVQSSTVRGAPGSPGPTGAPVSTAKRKLSYNEQREFEALPERIAALEEEQKTLETRSAAPEFYKEGAEAIRTVMTRLETIGNELHVAYERWLELEALATKSS